MQVKEIKESLKGEERRTHTHTHTDNVMTTKRSSGGLMSGLPRGKKSALLTNTKNNNNKT